MFLLNITIKCMPPPIIYNKLIEVDFLFMISSSRIGNKKRAGETNCHPREF